MLCSLLFHASILAHYWVEGLHTITYLLNCLPTKAISTTSPYFALHGVAPSYKHLRMFGYACYPNHSAKAAHKLAPRSTRCIFLGYSADHKGYRCIDLTTNNIVISRHAIFHEADFSFSASPRLTNDLDIFLQDDSPSVALMPAPLLAPRVLLGFPPLAIAGGQTARPGDPTAPGTEASGPTARLGVRPPPPHTTAGGLTVSPGGLTTRPCTAPSSSALLTLTPPLDSTHATRGPGVHDSGRTTSGSVVPALSAALLVSPLGYVGATGTASASAVTVGEGCTCGTSGQPSPDDHTGEARLLAFNRQTHPVGHLSINQVVGALLHPRRPH
jgi:hypothetical protein